MPIISQSTYAGAPPLLFNGHLQTIIPSVFRKIEDVNYTRERLTMSDGDFIDVDWLKNDNDKLVVLTHGLEGDSHRHYIKGTAKLFAQNGWDVLAWNCRSCSGEMNRAFRLYNHGEIGDIAEIIKHSLAADAYKNVVLVGFSMGGNITLKYLGVHGSKVPDVIRAGVAISAPTDLKSSAELLDWRSNWFYRQRFMGKLFKKIQIKAELYPNRLDLSLIKKVKVWKDFDNFFSAPLNGYRDADDFYEQASAINFIAGTTVPVLVCNAANDPILTPECVPFELAKAHPLIFAEMPQTGGHVSFVVPYDEFTWAERRALEFATNALVL